jgi:hypothetical protein
MKALTALLIAAACLFFVAPAHAQKPTVGFPAVDCSKSFLSLNPALLCMASRGVTNDNRMGGKEYHVAGVLNDRALFMVLSIPATGSIRAYPEQTSVNVLKNLNEITRRQSRDWSAIRTDGNSSHLNFKTELEDCVGFDHAGPLKEGGYAWALRGYLCVPRGQAIGFADVKPILAAARVGNTRDNLNAYGQPVQPLTAKARS